MKNYRRLFKFLKGKYHWLVMSLLMVVIVQTLEFITPLLVKVVLDDCIMGIEYSWVEVRDSGKQTVKYQDRYFIQERYLTTDAEVIKEVSIVLSKNGFYFVEDSIIDGTKSIKKTDSGYELKITNKTEEKTYEAIKISKDEVFAFYKPMFPTIITYIVLIFFKTVIVIACNFFKAFTINKVVNYLANAGRTAALRSVEHLPISVFESEPAGKTASRITHDVDGMIIMYRQLINLFASVALSFIFAYVGMFYLNYKLALLTFFCYPFVYLWIRFFLKKLKTIAVKVNESRSMLTAKTNEVINGIQILQIFNFKKQTVEEFDKINDDYRKEQLKDVKLGITLGWNMINIIRSLITTIIVVYFGLQYLNFSGIVITAGLIYAYNQYLTKIIEPVNIIFTQISSFEHSHVQIDRIHKLIEGKQEDDTKTLIPRYRGDVKFDNIWFSYVDKEYVLKGVSIDIKAGQFVGLVGHTGSGKSSMMNLLLRFYDLTDPLSGKITVDGMDIAQIPKRTYREHIGIVLQEPIMIRGTIADNIRFGKEGVSDEQIIEVLKEMGGYRIIKKFPNGINQEISRNGVNMSAGEKQIISLARAIIHDPAILIMDEATSHIDTETEEIVKQSLNVACKGRTTIVIAHRLSTVFDADKIFVLDHGLKVEEGTHQELVKLNGVYANIYRSQVANIQNLKTLEK